MTTYSSDYLNAERLAASYRDTSTPEQKRWDEHANAVSEIAAKLRGLTYDRMTWASKAGYLLTVSRLSSDLERELAAMRVDGYRPGEWTGRIEAPKPVTEQVARDQRGETA